MGSRGYEVIVRLFIVEGKGEDTVQFFEEIDALVFVEGEDDFAVRTRLKGVLSGVMCTDIAVVVYLTVDGKDLLAVGRVQRLPTRLRVDDRKPLVCKDCGAAYINTAPVRSAMADFLCHF